MPRVHYWDDVPYTIERGPHRGWTWYYFELADRSYKLLTQEGAEKGYRVEGEPIDKSAIYANDTQHKNGPWPSYHNLNFDCLITVDVAIKIVRHVFVAFDHGITVGEVRAQQAIKKSLGL